MVKFFVATGLAVASATDCGRCWEIDAETGKCVPQSDKIQLSCTSNTMSMVVDPCVLEETHNYEGAFVGSDESVEGCQLRGPDSSGELWLNHGLNECGTSMQYDAETGKIIFKNNMKIPPKAIHDTIYTSNPLEWSFQCSYDTSYDITSDEMTVDSSSHTDAFKGVGQFDLSLSFYASSLFEDEIDSGAAEHQVGKPINFGITFNSGVPLNGLTFAPTSCEVVNVANSDEVFGLWNSMDDLICNSDDHPLDFAVHQSPSPTDKQFYGLSYSGFAFNSVSTDAGQQLLKCHVEICNTEMLGTVCNSDCSEEPDDGEGECKNQPTTYDWTLHPETAYYDNDWEKYYPEYYDHELDLNAGDTIRLSTLCTSKWISPYDLGYGEEAGCDQYLGGLTPYSNICAFENRDITPDHADRIFDSEVWITQKLNKLEDGSYITMLNCPQCGCTEGCYDAVTFDELKAIAQNGGENADLERRLSQPPQKLSETRGRGSGRGPQ